MIHLDPAKRHDYVILFDIENGNPNGDPDAGNMPRVDPETMHGFTTDVSIKRKVRDYLQMAYDIPMFIQSETALNRLILDAAAKSGYAPPKVELDESDGDEKIKDWLENKDLENIELIDGKTVVFNGESQKESDIKKAFALEPEDNEIKPLINSLAKRLAKSVGSAKSLRGDQRDKTRERLIQDYFDIRLFGAVLSTGLNAGQVRGPVQITFAKSLHPIFRMDCSITRVAVTKESDKKSKDNTMARKSVVPYALYRAHAHYNPYLARRDIKQGLSKDNLYVSQEDLGYFSEALWKGFDNDHSHARHLRPRGLYVFTHMNPRGNAPSHRLFQTLKIELVRELAEQDLAPRKFEDYQITFFPNQLNLGTTQIQIIDAESLKEEEVMDTLDNAVVVTKVYHEDFMQK